MNSWWAKLLAARIGFIPGIIWLVIIIILLLLPGSDLPQETWLTRIYFDKWVHVGMFGLLALLFFKAFAERNNTDNSLKKVAIILAVSCIAFGWLMEWAQLATGSRSYDMYDVLADAIGAVAAVVVGYILFKKRPGI